jgi:hypothetical protein
MNNKEMHFVQDSKVDSQLRMSNSKDICNTRNRIRRLFQLMKEGKSIEGMNNVEMQIPQESKAGTRIRMPQAKDPCICENNLWK